MPKVLISDALSPAAVAVFESRGIEVDVNTGLSESELIEAIGGYDGLAVRSATKVTAQVLDAAPDLKVVGRAGIGIDNIDLDAATARGVVVMNTPFGNSVTTAEHTIAMMLALARQLPAADRSTRAGKWEKSRFMGMELAGKVLGLIGCGNIGAIVADRAHGLKMRVIAYDPYLGARAGAGSRRREGRDGAAPGARRRDLAAHAAERGHPQSFVRRGARQDQAGRADHQLRARRPARRGGAASGDRRRATSPARRSTRSPRSRREARRCSTSSRSS